LYIREGEIVMKTPQLIVYAVLTAVLAGVVTLVTWKMNGFPLATEAGNPLTYISFIAWATYFLFGASPKPAVHAFVSMIAGIVAAILMFVLSLAFGFVPWWAVPLGVTILVIFMMLAERVKPISNVAAIFVGTGLYFSLNAAGAFGGVYDLTNYVLVGVTELIYVAIGFIAGYITIQFAGLVTKSNKSEE
jgi:hypothetical protein